jgi:hypothetical protein
LVIGSLALRSGLPPAWKFALGAWGAVGLIDMLGLWLGRREAWQSWFGLLFLGATAAVLLVFALVVIRDS